MHARAHVCVHTHTMAVKHAYNLYACVCVGEGGLSYFKQLLYKVEQVNTAVGAVRLQRNLRQRGGGKEGVGEPSNCCCYYKNSTNQRTWVQIQ